MALGGGGACLVHVDNACVEEVLSSGRLKWDDARAFTLILYLNPGHHTDHGGQLRLWPTPTRGDAVSAPHINHRRCRKTWSCRPRGPTCAYLCANARVSFERACACTVAPPSIDATTITLRRRCH